MQELPLNGRNFEQLVQLAPGVATVQSPNSAMQGRAAQYFVACRRPEGQAILLDDENLQGFWNNGIGSITGSSLGVQAIGELQILTNNLRGAARRQWRHQRSQQVRHERIPRLGFRFHS
jgi:hypothetical protein